MSTVPVRWNRAALQAIRVTHPGPPIVARALAVVHTAMYDAWAAYDDRATGTRLGGLLRRPPAERTNAHKRQAVSHAAYSTLVDLFGTEKPRFDTLMADLGFNPAETTTDPATPAGIGNLAARTVLEFRHGDGSNQLGTLHPGAYSDWTGYSPRNTPDVINDPGRWQPLRVSDGHGGTVVQKSIASHWGRVIGFALPDGPQDPPAPPAPPGSEAFRIQARDVLRYSAQLDDRSKVIAEYWADGPSSELPPGHWCLFAADVSARDGHDLDADIVMFFAMTNAILDASIASWGAKRNFDYVRPVTAIHHLFAGKQVRAWAGVGLGTALIDGGDWQPYQATTVVTPPFAEYYSGHSVFSAAAAEVLTRFTGSDNFGSSVTIKAGSSRVEPGLVPAHDVTLAWDTFSLAADEAGLSRRYGGIHFEDGDRAGRAVGRTIGARAWRLAQRYRHGTV
jgi:hypothetical protein